MINPRGDRRRMRIGLLGGSFNPAHAGHGGLARLALRAFALDQVWLMVSPGNPLKPRAGMAPLADRLAGAAALGDGRRVIATDLERHLGTRYTVDTVRRLRRRFPRARFVWLMGADGLADLPRWRRWTALARLVPIAVVPRPPYNHRALAGRAAQRLRRARHPSREAPVLARVAAPGWVFLPARETDISATALRAARAQRHDGTPRRDGRAGQQESRSSPGSRQATGPRPARVRPRAAAPPSPSL